MTLFPVKTLFHDNADEFLYELFNICVDTSMASMNRNPDYKWCASDPRVTLDTNADTRRLPVSLRFVHMVVQQQNTIML